MKKIKIQLIISFTIILILSNILSLVSFASFNIDSANLYSKGDCGELIKKDGSLIHTTYVVYQKDGKEYPAYCQDKFAPGVGEVGSYNVNVDSLVSNVEVWRAAVNGFPYKTPAELGCANEKEAFVATKMAIYSVLYGYNSSQFSGIGDAGNRVVNAISNIMNAGKGVTKKSSDLNIISISSGYEVDIINNKYISNTYKVTSEAPMKDYNVNIHEIAPEGILITDENNNIKTEFSSNENFKILIPITELGNGGKFKISVNSGVETKPVFYGKSNSANQDYALTGMMYEDGIGEIVVNYPKNETKLKIFKKDNDTQEVLSGAKFDLLDENKNVLYTNLISNEEGEILIDNLLPNIYYLKETKAPTDYKIYEDYIKLEVGFNEEMSVIINNIKNETPNVDVTKNKIEVKQKAIQIKQETQVKLPKTGM